MFIGSAMHLIIRHWIAACLKFLGTLYMHAHHMRNSNQILHGVQTILKAICFTCLTTSPALAIMFLTGMLMHDLSAVANLLVHNFGSHNFTR